MVNGTSALSRDKPSSHVGCMVQCDYSSKEGVFLRNVSPSLGLSTAIFVPTTTGQTGTGH